MQLSRILLPFTLAPRMIVLQHVKAGQMETLGTRLKGACNMLHGSRPNGNELFVTQRSLVAII